MSTTTSNPTPTIPATWSLPSTCQDTTQWWYAAYSSGEYYDWDHVFAVPTLDFVALSQASLTHDCVPPDYYPTATYITTGGCPAGYTEQCRSTSSTYDGQEGEVFTCCPSVRGDWVFTCETDFHTRWYGCMTSVTSRTTWTGSFLYDYTEGIESGETTRPVFPSSSGARADTMNAYGVVMLQTRPTIPSTTSQPAISTAGPTDPATDQKDGGSNGLSAGAAAGIGVAVSIVAIGLVAAAVFLFLWRRRAAAAQEKDQPTVDDSRPAPALGPGHPVKTATFADDQPTKAETPPGAGAATAASAPVPFYRFPSPLSSMGGSPRLPVGAGTIAELASPPGSPPPPSELHSTATTAEKPRSELP